jgi:hypothetical protein
LTTRSQTREVQELSEWNLIRESLAKKVDSEYSKSLRGVNAVMLSYPLFALLL